MRAHKNESCITEPIGSRKQHKKVESKEYYKNVRATVLKKAQIWTSFKKNKRYIDANNKMTLGTEIST